MSNNIIFSSRTVLPLNEPVLNSYNLYASLLSLTTSNAQTWPWVMNNFIQIMHMDEYGTFFFDTHRLLFNHCPWVNTFKIPKEMINSKWGSFKNFVIEQINLKRYLWLSVNQYYLPTSDNFNKEHYIHEIFIYGYDIGNNLVFIADNFNDGKYIHCKCTFEELEKAYSRMDYKDEFSSDVFLYTKKEDVSEQFNINQIFYFIKCYLESKNTYNLTIENCTFGLQAAELLSKKMEVSMFEMVDIRGFHLLWERSKLMVERFKYIKLNYDYNIGDQLINDYLEFEKSLLILRNLLLKYNHTFDKKILVRANKILNGYIKDEKIVLSYFLNSISND